MTRLKRLATRRTLVVLAVIVGGSGVTTVGAERAFGTFSSSGGTGSGSGIAGFSGGWDISSWFSFKDSPSGQGSSSSNSGTLVLSPSSTSGTQGVPEPSAVGLVAFVGVGLLGRRRRRKAARQD